MPILFGSTRATGEQQHTARHSGVSERNRPKQIGDCQLFENGEDL